MGGLLRVVFFWPNVIFSSIQIFTGASPFGNDSLVMVMRAIMEGRRPPRPMYPAFTDNLWMLVQCCWDHDPDLRPNVSQVLDVLNGLWVSIFFRRSALVDPTLFSRAQGQYNI